MQIQIQILMFLIEIEILILVSQAWLQPQGLHELDPS